MHFEKKGLRAKKHDLFTLERYFKPPGLNLDSSDALCEKAKIQGNIYKPY